MNSDNIVLKMTGIEKVFSAADNVTALNGVDFHVRRGGIGGGFIIHPKIIAICFHVNFTN